MCNILRNEKDGVYSEPACQKLLQNLSFTCILFSSEQESENVNQQTVAAPIIDKPRKWRVNT